MMDRRAFLTAIASAISFGAIAQPDAAPSERDINTRLAEIEAWRKEVASHALRLPPRDAREIEVIVEDVVSAGIRGGRVARALDASRGIRRS
jgi:hypothetical protein